MKEMLPCPFCGAEAEYRTDLSDNGKGEYSNHVVMCSMCVGSNCGNSKKDAIFEWNLRVEKNKIKSLETKLKYIQDFVNKQAEDETIWIRPEYISEEILLRHLSDLHRIIEQPTPDTIKEEE